MTSATNTQAPRPPKNRGLGTHCVLQRAVLASLEMRDMNKSRVITIGSAAAVLALTAGTASAATTLVNSRDIQDGSVHKVDLTPHINRDLTKAEQPGTAGTVYRVAHYAVAGSGAIATVSCADNENKSQKYVAIAGGVQMINADKDSDVSNDMNPVVSDSFPGRMHWATGDGTDAYPKPDRLDGWVVRFGSQPMNGPISVWAVCMKRPTDVKVQTTNY